VVCASNQNRSMEAHDLLSREGFSISSYGTAEQVKLPGPTISQPNVYQFGTPYQAMYEELKAKDQALYTQNGVLHLLERNMRIKKAPEKFQESAESDAYDVIITCEKRCFDAVFEDLSSRYPRVTKLIHIINLDIKDTPEAAKIDAKHVLLPLLTELEKLNDLEGIEQVLEDIQYKKGRDLLHTVL